MNVFADVNFLVALFTRETSVYEFTTRILSVSGFRFPFYTSGVCLAIAFYFATRKYNAQKARLDIELLVQHMRITNCGSDEVLKTIANKQITDIEDGMGLNSKPQ